MQTSSKNTKTALYLLLQTLTTFLFISLACKRPAVVESILYCRRKCLIYGNILVISSCQLVGTNSSTVMQKIAEIRLDGGDFSTPLEGALLLIQNPFKKVSPYSISQNCVLSPGHYNKVKMRRQFYVSSGRGEQIFCAQTACTRRTDTVLLLFLPT